MGKGKSIEQWQVDYIRKNHTKPVKEIAKHLGCNKSAIYARLKMLNLDKKTLDGEPVKEEVPKKIVRFPAVYSNKQWV